jgi:hypothetical protein
MYLRKVGFEILRYSMASPVVSTSSLCRRIIEVSPFVRIFLILTAKYVPRIPWEGLSFFNYPTL